MRASAAAAFAPAAPDLAAMAATTSLPDTILTQPATEAASSDPAQLLSSAAWPQRNGPEVTVNTDEVLALAAQRACTLTGADGSAVALLEGDSVVCRARAGLIAPKVGASVNVRSSFTGQSFRTGRVLCCEDTEHDPRVSRASCRKVGVGSILVVPVEHQGKPVGIIEVFSTSRLRFGSREITALESMAKEVADALRGGEGVDTPQQDGQSERAPASPPLVAEDAAGGEVQEEVAESSEAASEQEQDTLARQPKRPIRIPWLVFSTLAVSCATIGLAGHHSSYVARAPAPLRPPVRIEPPSPRKIVSTAAPPQMVATGSGVLLDVKHNSHADFTSISIELSAPVKVKAEQLSDPERIYFDLAETHVAAEFMDAMHMKAIAVEDRLVSRVRVAQRSEDTTRVVLDLNRRCEFAYVMSDAPPFRLVIELHAAKDTRAREATRHVVAAVPSVATPASPSTSKMAASNRPLRIVIDPGHGGWDNGSVGPTGLREKELVLDVAERLGKLLKARLGAEIILTRTDDSFVPLESRPALANSAGADLFVSIHGNSSSKDEVRGVETYYIAPAAYKGSAPSGAESAVTASRRLAAAVQRALYASLSGADPLVHDRGIKAAALSVLEAPTMPSVLTEIAFVTNRREEQKLRRPEYRETIAEALFTGIKAYAARRQPMPAQTASQTTSAADHGGDIASDDLPGKSAQRGR
jgi:N-acetylmuramoyl-L-alanine amidase